MSSSPVETLDVVERKSVEIRESRHINALLAASAELSQRQFFTVRVKNGKYHLTAGKYLGVVPLNDELVLRVRPKVPTNRVVEILRCADESPIVIDMLERHYQPGGDVDVLELLIRALHGALSPI